MNRICFLILVFALPTLHAQYLIGNRSITIVDSSRSNRNIPIEIYYPAETAGTNTFPALGIYPLITLGHGFVMTVDAYYNFKDTLVPKGFVIVLVNTETSFSPTHLEFAKDLLFINNNIKEKAANDPAFFLHQFLNGRSCIMGHSMGGGSTFLAGSLAQPNQLDCIAGFAPAETNPGAIETSTQFDLPLIIFSGGEDGVTPPNQHHIPMYDSSASSCKYFVDILGGAHCYYANTNIACDFGESLSSPGISITREEQQRTTFHILIPWLNYYLRSDANGLNELNTRLDNSLTTSYQSICTSYLGMQEQGNWLNNIHWEINNKILSLHFLKSIKGAHLEYSIQDMNGQLAIKKHHPIKEGEWAEENLDTLKSGIYVLQLALGKKTKSIKFHLP